MPFIRSTGDVVSVRLHARKGRVTLSPVLIAPCPENEVPPDVEKHTRLRTRST